MFFAHMNISVAIEVPEDVWPWQPYAISAASHVCSIDEKAVGRLQSKVHALSSLHRLKVSAFSFGRWFIALARCLEVLLVNCAAHSAWRPWQALEAAAAAAAAAASRACLGLHAECATQFTSISFCLPPKQCPLPNSRSHVY